MKEDKKCSCGAPILGWDDELTKIIASWWYSEPTFPEVPAVPFWGVFKNTDDKSDLTHIELVTKVDRDGDFRCEIPSYAPSGGRGWSRKYFLGEACKEAISREKKLRENGFYLGLKDEVYFSVSPIKGKKIQCHNLMTGEVSFTNEWMPEASELGVAEYLSDQARQRFAGFAGVAGKIWAESMNPGYSWSSIFDPKKLNLKHRGLVVWSLGCGWRKPYFAEVQVKCDGISKGRIRIDGYVFCPYVGKDKLEFSIKPDSHSFFASMGIVIKQGATIERVGSMVFTGKLDNDSDLNDPRKYGWFADHSPCGKWIGYFKPIVQSNGTVMMKKVSERVENVYLVE